MSELVDWLRAQLDEDERVARAATAGPWRVAPEPPMFGDDETADVEADWTETKYLNPDPPYSGTLHEWRPNVIGDREGFGAASSVNAAHIARHDPARVLRDVAAKRAIVDDLRRYEGAIRQESATARPGDPIPANLYAARDALLAAVQHLASAYDDRPGYDESWRP